MEKYYTPDISEFHVGFEYEMFEDFDTLPEKSWHKFTYGVNGTDNPENLTYPLGGKMDNIRVKYLDKEDIEKLGWKQNKYNYNIGDWCLSGQIEYQNIEIDKEFVDYPNGAYTNWTEKYFNGKIKNKSELRKLMQQLQIL